MAVAAAAIVAAVGAASGIGGALVSHKAERARFKYNKRLKDRADQQAITDLGKAGHEALIAKDLLRGDTLRAKGENSRAISKAVSEAVVLQAAMGVTGNTANRVQNSIYAAEGDANTELDLEARAEFDGIDKQIDALTTGTERQLLGGQVVDFSTKIGTALKITGAAFGGAQAGISLYQGFKSTQTN
jgi:hypothetical protein